jgi:hypothetical protein
MGLTQQPTLRKWLLQALGELGGVASKSRVLKRMQDIFGDALTEDDWKAMPSNKEVKWQNRTAWERQHMVDEGLLKSSSEHGTWELSEPGWNAYRRLMGKPR